MAGHSKWANIKHRKGAQDAKKAKRGMWVGKFENPEAYRHRTKTSQADVTGQIDFDPNQLNESKAKIVVDLNSISTSYQDLTDALKTADWFNMKLFPEAVFVATKFEKIGVDRYQAKGMLTIRDQTVPVTLTFAFALESPSVAVIRGFTILKRTAFGVGQGEWASVVEVQDDVKVNFVVSLVR